MSDEFEFYVSAGGSKDFELVPPGAHPAYCYGLVDLGTQREKFDGKLRKKVRLLFETPTELDSEGKPLTIGATATADTSDKSNLRKWLQSWRGKPFSKEDLDKFKLSAVVGKACQLVVVHKPKGGQPGKFSDWIDNILPFPKNTQVPQLSRPLVKFSIAGWDQAVYDSLPNWMKKAIAESPEGMAKMGGKPAQQAANNSGGQPAQDDDNSLPF